MGPIFAKFFERQDRYADMRQPLPKRAALQTGLTIALAVGVTAFLMVFAPRVDLVGRITFGVIVLNPLYGTALAVHRWRYTIARADRIYGPDWRDRSRTELDQIWHEYYQSELTAAAADNGVLESFDEPPLTPAQPGDLDAYVTPQFRP